MHHTKLKYKLPTKVKGYILEYLSIVLGFISLAGFGGLASIFLLLPVTMTSSHDYHWLPLMLLAPAAAMCISPGMEYAFQLHMKAQKLLGKDN